MNCARCGAQLPNGAASCPACGEAVQYAQPNVYQQSYMQYQQQLGNPNGYPGSYQTPYYTKPVSNGEDSFLHSLGELPRAFLDSFVRPGEVLRGMVERRDRFSGLIVTVLVLALSFFGGMVLMRGFLGVLLRAIGALSGAQLAGTSASMNQGVSYIAGRVGPMTGGIVALCQLIAMIVPAAVFMVYICAICRVAFSWELFSGFVAVVSLNTVAVSLLAMAASLRTPWLALGVILCGMAVSYVKACSMLSLITARPDSQLFVGKLICVVAGIALTLILCSVAGGLLMRGVISRVMVLLSNVGSLI